MKTAISFMFLLALTTCLMAQAGMVLNYNQRAFELTHKYSMMNQSSVAEPVSIPPAEKKSPGKALMLSAIMPGAGELYAGSPLKAIFFFGIEVASWVGVGTYQAEGKDKENQFKDYADYHWSQQRYWDWMETFPSWPASNDPNGNGIPFEFDDYTHFEDDNGFTHNLPSIEDQQYYEMIGKYMTQFGPGWDDANNTTYAQLEDMYYWDGGTTNNSTYYMDLRAKSNDALEMAAYCFQAVMLNHVFSALDAGFTVRLHNRKIQTSMNIAPENYQGEQVAMGQITVNW